MTLLCKIFGHKFTPNFTEWKEEKPDVWSRTGGCSRCYINMTERMRLPYGLVDGIRENIDCLAPLAK